MPKFLILRFSSIGDIVLTTPVIRNLKQQVAGAEVHYATKKEYSYLLENNPHIDKIHLLGDSENEIIEQLKLENFDHIIDLHNNVRTLNIKRQLKGKSVAVDKLNVKKWLLVNLGINLMPNVHIVDRYMDTVKQFGVSNDGKGLDYFIPAESEVTLPNFNKNAYNVYAIGGQHETKKLPLPKMVELVRSTTGPLILIGGPEDKDKGEQLIKSLIQGGWPGLVINAAGKTSVNQSASIIKNAKQVYTHDTGMMHIAAAFKKKTISIWGNTVPSLGMTPYLTESVIIENTKLRCRPCSKIGHDACPKGHFKCMNELNFK